MKKLLAILLFSFIFFTAQIFSDDSIKEFTLGEVQCEEVSNEYAYKRICRLRYDGKYYLQINSSYTTSWIDIDESQLETLRAAMVKYQEWRKIAKEKAVDVTKEIPNSSITSNVSWSSGSDFYKGGYPIKLSFHILTIKNGESSSLVLKSSKVSSESNRYIDYETGLIFFIDSDADDFQNMISSENIQKAIKNKAKETALTDSLFN